MKPTFQAMWSNKDMMSDKVITNLEQVTTEWLTDVLSKTEALTQGAVAAFDVATGHGNWSTNARLIVHYTDEAEIGISWQKFTGKGVER